MDIETVIIVQLVLIGILVLAAVFIKIKEKRDWKKYKQMRWDSSIMGKIEREMKEKGEWDE